MQQDHRELEVRQVPQELLVPQETQVLRDLKEPQGQLDTQVHKVLSDLWDLKDHRVLRDIRVLKVQQVL